jgi:hypothetical protein
MRTSRLFAVAIVAGILAGCGAAPQKYNWGNYEQSLYSYYKDPTKTAAYAMELENTIQESEKTQKPVAPGIYAEYGYLLLQQGKSTEAVALFEKEKAKWPESTYLMDGMIKMAANQQKKPAKSKE